jgi:uncharacterized membrane protein
MQRAPGMEPLRDMLVSGGLPLHPAVVHVPLVLAALVPILLGWLVLRGPGSRRAWAALAFLQAMVVAGGLMALDTGLVEEERLEAAVPAWPVEMHERRARTFVVAAAGLLLLVGAIAAAPRAARVAAPVALVLSLLVAALGVSAGHAGGELVYRHGAGLAARP